MPLPSASPSTVARAASLPEVPREKFGRYLGESAARGVAPSKPAPLHPAAGPHRGQRGTGARQVSAAQGAPASRAVSPAPKTGQVIDAVNRAQARLDRILTMAQSGKSFTPAELLALQAQVSQASQQLDLAGKVVEKATSGVKQVLQTQV